MTETLLHPSTLLDAGVVNILRQHAAEADQQRQLQHPQLDILFRERWFKMFVPARYGGLGYTLPQALQYEEALAWVDGSIGWVVTLCAGAGWFCGFFHEHLNPTLLANDRLCFAGSGAATGTAEQTTDGYILDGTWKYASGATHATAFTANCVLQQHGTPVLQPNGDPVVIPFVLMPDEVDILPTWNAMGMQGTGSHSFRISQRALPPERRFSIYAADAKLPDHVYQYPFLQLAETTLAVNVLGMALRFAELASEMVPRTDLLQGRMAGLTAARREFYSAADTSWRLLTTTQHITPEVLQRVSETSHRVVHVAREMVNDIFPLCGLRAADLNTEINRVWRNFHTAAQHALFARSRV